MSTSTEVIQDLANREYKYGFVTDIEQDAAPRGLSEDIVRLISSKKNEPAWLLDWRLQGIPRVADDEGADLGQRQVRADRLSEHHLLLRSEEEAGGAEPR